MSETEIRPAGENDRRARRRARRHERWSGAPVGAIILLIVGGVLLAQNFGADIPGGWWAFLFLIPATGALMAAIQHYREAGQLSVEAIGSALSAAVFAVLWAAFFFNLGRGIIWPVLMIAIALGILARDYWRRD